jgi:REP element-mobilizing transposase RayT
MPRRRPEFRAGNLYHLYNKAVGTDLLFRTPENYQYFLGRIQKYLTSDLYAFCLMPTHYHLIIRLDEKDLSNQMQRLAMSYVKAFNNRYHRVGHLFQGRFQAKIIQSDEYLIYLSAYIHHNPVVARLVDKPENWDFSSYQVYMGKAESEIVNPEPILKTFAGGTTKSFQTIRQDYRRYMESWFF